MYDLSGNLKTATTMALFSYRKPKFTQALWKQTPAAAAGRKQGKYTPYLAGARLQNLLWYFSQSLGLRSKAYYRSFHFPPRVVWEAAISHQIHLHYSM